MVAWLVALFFIGWLVGSAWFFFCFADFIAITYRFFFTIFSFFFVIIVTLAVLLLRWCLAIEPLQSFQVRSVCVRLPRGLNS